MRKIKSSVRFSPPDKRDRIYKPRAAATGLPRCIDLRDLCSPVENQGNTSSCTGNAIVGALEVRQNKMDGKFVDLSRLFVYYNERVYEKTVGEDEGAYLRSGMKVIKRLGVCTEKHWPFSSRKVRSKPSEAAYADALNRKFESYESVRSFIGVKRALTDKNPVVFCFAMYDSFYGSQVRKTGNMPVPDTENEEYMGGHAVLCVGYDDDRKVVICRNSWGPTWGDKGYFYMPYAFFRNKDECDDMWVVL